MSVPDILHKSKSRALEIINNRIWKKKADFASTKIPFKSVKQFNVNGVGTINVPISELNWIKLRDVAHQSSHLNMEGQQTNHSWTIDGQNIVLQSPSLNSKQWKKLLSNVLTPMVMDLNTSIISAKLSRLILCKAGEKYVKSPVMIKSDHLATLLLQLPIENGNQAGVFNVYLGSRKNEFKTNRFSSGSSIAYVFYPECHCELKPVSTRYRLLLEFDLFRSTLPSPIELKVFKKDGKLILEALSGLFRTTDQSAETRPDALLIPLDHQYNQQNIFLKGMKGRDAVITKLFQPIRDFHVHLALFTDDPDQSTEPLGEPCSSLSYFKRRSFQIISGSKDVKHSTYWVSFDSSPLNFEFLCPAETSLVVPQCITRQPTESAKEPQINENALFTSALVVWPNDKMKKIQEKLQRFEHWTLLRKRAGLPPLTVTGSRSEMSSIANYIRNNMECLTEENILLAFQTICLQSQFHDTSLDVLQAVAEYTKWPNPSVPCGLIAEAIDSATKFNPPWNQVPELFHRLSNVDLWAKIEFCSALAETMKERKMSYPFASLSQLTHGLFVELICMFNSTDYGKRALEVLRSVQQGTVAPSCPETDESVAAEVDANDSSPPKRIKLEPSDEQGTANPVPPSCSKTNNSMDVAESVKSPEQPQKRKINANETPKPTSKVYTRSSVTTSAAITSERSVIKVEACNQMDSSEKIDVSKTNAIVVKVEAIVKQEPVVIDLT